MADGKIKISELTSALQISDNAKFPYSQDNGGTQATFGAEITQIARKIAEGVTLTNLTTTSKNLVGAINEIASSSSAVILYGTSAPTSQQGSNGNLYVKYTEGTGGADDTVDALYVKLDGAWCEIETGGGGGGASALSDLSDVDISSVSNGQILKYNGTSQKWVNANDSGGAYYHTYSTSAQIVGEWIDGSTLYEQTIYVDSFPNNTSKNLNTPANIDLLIDSFGFMKSTLQTGYFRTLPFAAGGTNDVRIDLNGGTLRVVTFSDWSSYDGYLTIRYTKSST